MNINPNPISKIVKTPEGYRITCPICQSTNLRVIDLSNGSTSKGLLSIVCANCKSNSTGNPTAVGGISTIEKFANIYCYGNEDLFNEMVHDIRKFFGITY